jgi:hypothetical protein
METGDPRTFRAESIARQHRNPLAKFACEIRRSGERERPFVDADQARSIARRKVRSRQVASSSLRRKLGLIFSLPWARENLMFVGTGSKV